MRWGVFKQKLISLRIIYVVHVLLDCNLFEINISYIFRNIKAIDLLRQQPSVQLIVTLSENQTILTTLHVSVRTCTCVYCAIVKMKIAMS